MVEGLLRIVDISNTSDQESFAVRMEVVDRGVRQLEGGSAFPPDGSIRNEYPFVYAVLYREDLLCAIAHYFVSGKDQLLISL